MADIIREDFEGTGAPSGWQQYTQGNGGSIDWDYTSSPLYGAQCLHLLCNSGESDWNVAGREFGADYNSCYFYIVLKVISKPSATQIDLIHIDSLDHNFHTAISWSYGDELRIWDTAVGYNDTTYSLSVGTLYHIWIERVRNTSLNVYVSTTPIKPGSPAYTYGDTSDNACGLVALVSDPSVEIKFDNVLVSDSSIGNSPFGESADATSSADYKFKRFYFQSSKPGDVSPSYSASWHKNSDAQSRLELVPVTIGSAMTTSGQIITDTASGARFMLARQFVSPPLLGQTIPAGTVKGQIRALESNTALNATLAFNVRVCNSEGTITQTVLDIQASDSTSTPPVLAASLRNRQLMNSSESAAISFSQFTVNDGDRLVIEVGYRKSNTTSSRYSTFRYGDVAASDLPEDNTGTDDYNPWIEFSQFIRLAAPIPPMHRRRGNTLLRR